jgi:rhomboid protease GluP
VGKINHVFRLHQWEQRLQVAHLVVFCDILDFTSDKWKEIFLDWKKFFDGLGLNGTRWQWRITRWEKNVRRFLRNPEEAGLTVTKIIIYVNLALFTIMVLKGAAAGMGMRPVMRPDTFLLVHMGGQYWPLVLGEGQWWRCLTYAFTHGGIIHIGFNMLVLYQIGPLVEFEIGKARFVFLYTFAALTATFAGFLWHPMVPVVGASGSLFGLIGFAVVFYHRMGDSIALQRRNFMFQWAVFAFIFGLLIGADNAGHLGGAIGGAVLGSLLPFRGGLLRQTDSFFRILGTGSTVMIVASLGFLVISWF